jgi:hypothetical protein
MKLLHALGHEAPGPGVVDRAPCVAGALRELSVGLLYKGNFFMYCACFGMLAKSSGTGFRAATTDKHGSLFVMFCLPAMTL